MTDLNFKGNITHQTIDSKKMEDGRSLRAVVIADLHGYTNNEQNAVRLAKAIMRENPDYIFIAGDIFHGGTPWEGGEKYESFKRFIDIISSVAPVFITWGNHDLRGMNPKNKDARFRNLQALEDIRKGQVIPLFNGRQVVGDMEVIGFVPSFELMEGDKLEGIPIQIHGIAHDKFIKEYEETGAKAVRTDLIVTYLGHDPHLIASSENGIGLGSLKKVDFFVTGHLHDGYRPVLKMVGLGKIPSFKFDCGWTEQMSLVDKDGNPIKKPAWPPVWGKTNLCRGIVYFDDDAQQHFWQSPDGKFYKNFAEEDNKQIWVPILEENAREEILDTNLHSMIISEGVAPGFLPSESIATVNVVDFKGTKLTR